MKPQIWIIFSFTLIFLIIFLSATRTRFQLEQKNLLSDLNLPKTYLEKATLIALIIVGIFGASGFGLVFYHGVQLWWEDDTIRGLVTALLLAAIAAYFIFDMVISRKKTASPQLIDERDELILNRACAPVGGTMMVLLAVWMVALTESFQETGLIPSYYLYLIFWSVVISNVMATLAGILMAYRRVQV